jgi:signal transduction histidine kinase
VSIRAQLLIVALTILVLPWAGCQYARELETALRASQEQALLASAGTIANALSAEPQRLFRGGSDARPFDAGLGDIYVFPLTRQPLLDGYRDDWNIPQDPQPWPTAAVPAPTPMPSTPSASAPTPMPSTASATTPTPDRAAPMPVRPATRLQAGITDRYLFLFMEVDDPKFQPEPPNPRLDRDRFDRIDLTLERPDGARETYFFATTAPGLIEAQTLAQGDDGPARAVPEPRIQAYWLQTAAGYRVEARVPLSLIGARLWITAVDGAAPTRPIGLLAPGETDSPDGVVPPGTGVSAGTSDSIARTPVPPAPRGRLFFAPPGLGALLSTFIRTGTRATLIDSNGLKLATAGASNSGGAGQSAESRHPWYRRLMALDSSNLPLQSTAPDRLEGASVAHALAGLPDAQWLRVRNSDDALLLAAAPLVVDGVTRGAIVLEQAGDQLVGLRDRALTRLFNLTLLATAVAVCFVFGFATWITVRIGRLRSAADSAVGADGEIRLAMPESGRRDEIGALSRSFEQLLARLNEHTHYLRTLGGKLSHELRTPLSIVRSSLDNLESEGLDAAQQVYVTRAREGGLRLQSILNALGAAARVEESIKQAERVGFDFRELLGSAVDAYRDSFRDSTIELQTPPDACFMRGAPDLIVQMLDKLIENAVDFCPPGGVIVVRLSRDFGQYELSVSNDGPPIPEAMLGRLFESLFEQRAGRDDKPHFGLGLYIVRLIAEFHGGRAAAANRTDAGGAVFTVTLPII